MLRRITLVTFNNLHIACASRFHTTAAAAAATRAASASTAAAAQSTTDSTQKWDLYAGILVERRPIVSKSLNKLETDFQELLWKIEYENSLKSNHELQHERELAQRSLIKKGKVEVDLDDSAAKQTAQDLKDAYTEELKKFKFAERTTSDDAKQRLTSTDRCLEESIYLLLQEKLGSQQHYLLPQGKRAEGETMRQTAERIVREKCGDQLQVQFYGNAPCGFYKYKYPTSMRGESIGAKVFFYHVTLQQGNLTPASSSSDKESKAIKYEWLTKEQLQQKITNAAYAESVGKFIL